MRQSVSLTTMENAGSKTLRNHFHQYERVDNCLPCMHVNVRVIQVT